MAETETVEMVLRTVFSRRDKEVAMQRANAPPSL
jgi:hypothetical protein